MSSLPLIEEDQPIYGVAECGIFVNPAIFSRNTVHPSPEPANSFDACYSYYGHNIAVYVLTKEAHSILFI